MSIFSVSESGMAIWKASSAEAVQCIEMDLASVYPVDAIYRGRAVVREQLVEMAQVSDEKTFGTLLKPLLSSPHIPTDMKTFLQQIRAKRTYLTDEAIEEERRQLGVPEGWAIQ